MTNEKNPDAVGPDPVETGPVETGLKPVSTTTTENNGFDTRAFMRAEFQPREGTVDVSKSALKEFFHDGNQAVWKVRGLTANEIARSNEASERNGRLETLINAMTTQNRLDIADGVKEMIGIGDDVHSEIAKMLEHLIFGSINPEVPRELAVRIATVAPVEFYMISRKIMELTGLGHSHTAKKKPKPSGNGLTCKKA